MRGPIQDSVMNPSSPRKNETALRVRIWMRKDIALAFPGRWQKCLQAPEWAIWSH